MCVNDVHYSVRQPPTLLCFASFASLLVLKFVPDMILWIPSFHGTFVLLLGLYYSGGSTLKVVWKFVVPTVFVTDYFSSIMLLLSSESINPESAIFRDKHISRHPPKLQVVYSPVIFAETS